MNLSDVVMALAAACGFIFVCGMIWWVDNLQQRIQRLEGAIVPPEQDTP